MPPALLICNGELPKDAVLRSIADEASFVLCADGGANAARRLGIVPDAIIGDFDSISNATRRHYERLGVPLLREPDQQNTDFEKGLLHLKSIDRLRVIAVGVTGFLLDHTFGNVSILLRHARDMDIAIIDRFYRIDTITRPRRFASFPGQRVSIVPLPAARGVTYAGLKFPLRRAALVFGEREGTCNEANGRAFRISFDEGVLMVFRESERGVTPSSARP